MSSRTLVMILVCQTLHASAGKQCMRCAAGKFKSPDMLFSPCSICMQNTFSSSPGAARCDACPPFSASAAGSSRCTFEPCRGQNYSMGCVCPVGTTGPDGGPCLECVGGTYKNGTGAARCDNCSSTKTSVSGSASCFCKANYVTTGTLECLPCMNGMISRENSAVCFCPNGTTLVDGRCAQIYSEGLRLSGFIDIVESNSTNTSSSTNLDSLMQELIMSIALQYNISEDLVQVVFTTTSRNLLSSHIRVDIIILATSIESFASVVNTTIALPMLQAVQRTVLPISLNEGTIVLCGDNEISIATACVCNRRYTRSAGTCSKCAPGTSKATDGDEACGECSNNTFSRTGAAECSKCPLTAKTRQNHTSCACNTGFVFFDGVCRQTEDVYLNVSGTLQMPDGAFTASQLQAILVDGMSIYLNFSREFITIRLMPVLESTDTTDAYTTNGTSRTNTTTSRTIAPTPAPGNARRLLYALPVDYDFTAFFQIPRGDQIEYAKIEKFLNDMKYEATPITDRNGYRIIPRRVELFTGYLSADGNALGACADGQTWVFDSATETLICPVIIIDVQPKSNGMVTGEVVLASLAITLLLIGVAVVAYRNRIVIASVMHSVIDTNPKAPASTTMLNAENLCMFPPRLQFPSTVTFEYQVLPTHSI